MIAFGSLPCPGGELRHSYTDAMERGRLLSVFGEKKRRNRTGGEWVYQLIAPSCSAFLGISSLETSDRLLQFGGRFAYNVRSNSVVVLVARIARC